MAEVKSNFLSVSPYLGPPVITDVKTFSTFTYQLANIPPALYNWNAYTDYYIGSVALDSDLNTGQTMSTIFVALQDMIGTYYDHRPNNYLNDPGWWGFSSSIGNIYDPATGYMSGVVDSSYLPRIPTYVLGTDGQTLYPIVSRTLNGIYLQSGLNADSVAKITMQGGEGGFTANAEIKLMFNYDAGHIIDVTNEGIFLVGSNLYADGLLTLVNPTGTLLNDMTDSFLSIAGTEGGILINGIGRVCVYPLPPMPTGSGDVSVTLLTASFTDPYSHILHPHNQSRITSDVSYNPETIWRVTGTVTWSSGNLGAPFVSGPWSEGFSCPSASAGVFGDIHNVLGAAVPAPFGGPGYNQDNWGFTVVGKAPASLTNGQVLAAHGLAATGSMSASGWVCYISGNKLQFDVTVGPERQMISVATSSSLTANTPFVVSFGQFQSGALPFGITPPAVVNGTGTLKAGGTASYYIKLNTDALSSVYTTGAFVVPEDFLISNGPPIWAVDSTYYVGTAVSWSGTYYVSLIDYNNALQPDLNPTEWATLTGPWPDWVGLDQTGGYPGIPNYVSFSGTAYRNRGNPLANVNYIISGTDHGGGPDPGTLGSTGYWHWWPYQWAGGGTYYSFYYGGYTLGSVTTFSGSATASLPYQGWNAYVSITGTNRSHIPLIATGSQSGTLNSAYWALLDLSPANTASQNWAPTGNNCEFYLGRYQDLTNSAFTSWKGTIYEGMFLDAADPSTDGTYLGFYPNDTTLQGIHLTALSASTQKGQGAYIAYTSFQKAEYFDTGGPITYDIGTGEIVLDANVGAFTTRPDNVVGNGLSYLPVLSASGTGSIFIAPGFTDDEVFWGFNSPRTLITVASNRGDGGVTTYSPFLLFSLPIVASYVDVGDGNGYVPYNEFSGPFTILTGTWVNVRGGGFLRSDRTAVFGTSGQGPGGSNGYIFSSEEHYTEANGFIQIIDDQHYRMKIPTIAEYPIWNSSASYKYPDMVYGPYTTAPPYYTGRYFFCMTPNVNVYPLQRTFLFDYGGAHSYDWLSAPDRARGFLYNSYPYLRGPGVTLVINGPGTYGPW